MRFVFALVLLAGVGVAGFAAYLAMQQFNNYEKELQIALRSSPYKLTRVFVTNKPLRYGQMLQESDLKAVEWPVKGVPQNAFTNIDELLGGEDAGVSAQLEKGKRAFALKVDVASGVSGFLRPGDRVDVYWNGGVNGEQITKLVLENIQLIAIDQISGEVGNQATVARTVTVAVSPQVVGELIQAQSSGSLLLSLRAANEGDDISGNIQINQTDLLDIQVRQVNQRRVCTVVTRKGGEAVRIEIPCNDN
jgi:pilus assembly protein CpaB